MGPDWSGLPQPELGEPLVSRQRLPENDIGIVPGAGEKGHHRDLIRFNLIQYGVEAGLTLMKRYRHFVEKPAASQRFCNSAYQRVCSRMSSRTMGGEDERAST
jgi:hypothetical protein